MTAQPPHIAGPGALVPVGGAAEASARLVRGMRRSQDGPARLGGTCASLRELRPSDAGDLFESLTRADVTRFISPPPATVPAFQQFVGWAERERGAGRHVCLAILRPGTDIAVGLIQIRALDRSFRVSEWGFALAAEYWGSGLFIQSARLALHFAFTELGVHRLEARAAVRNGRGNAALRKLGAVQEGILRQSFLRNGEYLDQVLWSILADDWLQLRTSASPTSFH
jgi:RimJ/RimL family protein N-acetyltransferase